MRNKHVFICAGDVYKWINKDVFSPCAAGKRGDRSIVRIIVIFGLLSRFKERISQTDGGLLIVRAADRKY